jgi:DHA1 family multidrug resistance protein-like MFS transporter
MKSLKDGSKEEQLNTYNFGSDEADFSSKEKVHENKYFTDVIHSALIIFTAILGIGFIIPFLADFSKRIGGEKLVGLIYSGFAISRLVAVPTFSFLSDRYGRKIFIVSGLIVYSITSFLYAHAENFLSLFFVRLIHGAASSMIVPISFAYAMDKVPYGKEGLVAAILGGSLLLGFGLGPSIGGALAKFYGENIAFYMMGVAGIIATIISLILMREPEKKKRASQPVMKEIKDIISSNVFIFSFLIWFLVMWQRGSVISYSPLLLENEGFDKVKIGLTLTTYAIVSSVLQYSSARFVDKVNDKLSFSLIFCITSTIPLPILSYVSSPSTIFLVFIFSGALSAFAYPFLMAEIGKEAKRKNKVGGTIGFMDWAFSLGNILGPTSMGFITNKVGLNLSFLILGATQFLTFTLILIALKLINKRKEIEEKK